MNSSREILIAVFDAARRIEEPVARRAFVDWALRDEPEEARRMHAMLAEDDAAQAWFRRAEGALAGLAEEVSEAGASALPAQWVETTELDDLSRSLAPRYSILQTIGGGGGGLVFLAEQLLPVQRKVAVKLLQSGLESPDFIAAFRREQQVLASMNHPNIAAIFDAGTTNSGRPYLVMEFVEGVNLTRYCDDRRLTLRQRLDLFLQVCSAIGYAHRKGIIHRDLKPANILVVHADEQPLPKVIDFGIADVGERAGDTSRACGTPTYMSPEPSDSGTLADIYSLGVVLYELLAGPPPWSPRRLAEPAMPVASRLSALEAPSLAKLAGLRGLKPHELPTRLKGDLEAIIAKAIAPDPRLRYDTVDSLATDIRRHSDGLPVKARPASRRYIAACFFARHRLVCFSGAAILLAMVIGTVVAVSFSIREHRARRESERARAKVAELFVAASARENITRAAILLGQKKIGEADALLKQTPVSGIEPSTEAAYVFRLLGERNAVLGRWKEASECCERLRLANRLVPAESIVSGFDFLFGVPAILEAGEVNLYKSLRQEMLERLPAPKSLSTAEHMVKGCLLIPADRAMLDALRPMADRLRPKGGGYSTTNAWAAMATMLFDFRDGRFQSARDGADRTLRFARIPSCRAAILCIRAMAEHALGDDDAARSDLAGAGAMIRQASPRVIVENPSDYDASEGSWAAWAIARILHREASALVAR